MWELKQNEEGAHVKNELACGFSEEYMEDDVCLEWLWEMDYIQGSFSNK